jgi:hypothetical protein
LNERNDYGAKETVTKAAPTKETVTLILPPLPGTDTAHPAFAIDAQGRATWKPDYPKPCILKWVRSHLLGSGEFSQLAAAAIAHYWYEHSQSLKSCTSDWDFALNQYGYWSAIAAGSREYDGAEVVGYQP